MKNIRLIEEAVKLVNELFEYEGIYETTSSIRSRVTEWYNRTDITDAEMLAAVAISGSYEELTPVTWKELEVIKEFYFPSSPIELNNFHIGEIEEAQKDMLWT